MEPSQKYSHQAYGKRKESEPDIDDEIRKDASPQKVESQGSKERNFVHTSEPNAKAIEKTFFLAEMEKCPPKAKPSRASLELSCRSHTLPNITHEPVEDSTIQRDSSGIPQVSIEGSPQGTNQSNISQTPEPIRRAYGDPLVFDIDTNTIQKLVSKLIK
eukprot:Gb_10942 [translate_table: standard]